MPTSFVRVLEQRLTILTSSLSSTDTLIEVESTADFPATGHLLIRSEVISYTSKTAFHFHGCTRGVDSTTASTYPVVDHHGVRTQVYAGTIGQDINDLQVAVEGVGGGGSGGNGNITFADAPARLAAVPTAAGILGLQLDTGSLWRSTGTSAGNWRRISHVVAAGTVAGGSTFNTDVSLANILKVALTGSGALTLATPTNMLDGDLMEWWLKQPASGGPVTLAALGSGFVIPTSSASLTLSTANSAVDRLCGEYDGVSGKVRITGFVIGY